MKAYWIAVYKDLQNPENIKKYAEKALPAIKKHNGINPLADRERS